MEGYGVMTWPEGKIYKGYYKDNNRHGQGEFILKNGVIIKSSWENGLLHGK